MIFAISSLAMVTAVGAGVDLSRTFVARQQLSNAAALTCQYSARPTVVAQAYNGDNGPQNYINSVNQYAKVFLTAQNTTVTQTNASPFSYVQGGASSVKMNADVPTFFAGVVGITAIPISSTLSCAAGVPQVNDTNPSTVFSESFENAGCSGNCFKTFPPNGQAGTTITSPVNTFPSTYAYVGSTGTQWSAMGYCLETDHVGRIKSTVPDGSYSAELDCDNGSGSRGNSSISTKIYLTAGSYELRYNYASRVLYPNYTPAYICGSTAADIAWANDSRSVGSPVANATRSNQMNVYLDQDAGNHPPTHQTLDNSQTLAGANLIDACVYADQWVERSVVITVSAAGYYWATFAADGTNDSYGAQLDNVRFCRGTCAGTVADAFPTPWKTKPLLFEDTFDNPTYAGDSNAWLNKGGNPSNSVGASGSGSGWPGQTVSGWGAGPYNEILYFNQGAAQGAQYVGLDGYNGFSTGSATRNRAMSRQFYLDPGYYQVNYNYNSEMDFKASGVTGTYCYAAPGSGAIFPSNATTALNGVQRFSGATFTADATTNIVGVFMSHGSLVSTPVLFAPNDSSSLGATTTYNNPDGSVSTTPSVPQDTVNWFNYNSNVPNPVIDTCGYQDSYGWVARTTYVRITKPGVYWLTFSANGGLADGKGPSIDDVKLTALNSLYGAAPSGTSVTIPTPGPAPGSTLSFSGFSILADRPTP